MVKAYDFFKKGTNTEQEFLEKYCVDFIGWKGLEMNSYLRGEKTREEVEKVFMENNQRFEQFFKDTEKFTNLIKKINNAKNNTFYTIQRTNELDERHSTDKKIVSDAGFYVASVTADISELDDVYDVDNGWTVISFYDKDNQASEGLFMGQFIEDYFNKYYDGFCDWEGLFVVPPMRKFKRKIIDETNRIILQTPYAPERR